MSTVIDIGTLITSTPGVCGGRPRIAGRRISVSVALAPFQVNYFAIATLTYHILLRFVKDSAQDV